MDAFEEIVRIEDLPRLKDPLKDRLIELVSQHAPEAISR